MYVIMYGAYVERVQSVLVAWRAYVVRRVADGLGIEETAIVRAADLEGGAAQRQLQDAAHQLTSLACTRVVKEVVQRAACPSQAAAVRSRGASIEIVHGYPTSLYYLCVLSDEEAV